MIETKTLHEWREILAYFIIYSEDGGKALAGELAEELEKKKNDQDSALLCYIVANDF